MERVNIITVSYFSSKLFNTIDTQALFQVLFSYFGERSKIVIQKMSETESQARQNTLNVYKRISDYKFIVGIGEYKSDLKNFKMTAVFQFKWTF